MMDIKGVLLQWFINFLTKKLLLVILKIKICQTKNQLQKLHKPIIKKIQKQNVHPPFIDNIWGVDLGDMQLISKFDKAIRFLLCVIDIFSKYAWVIPLKDKNVNSVANAFRKSQMKSNCKPNKKWVEKGSE